MNLKLKILSGILAGGMLFSFVPSTAAESNLHDIQIVEEYVSYISDVEDVWRAYFYLARKYVDCSYDTVRLTKMYGVLLDLKNKIQKSNFRDRTLEEYVNALFFVHEACLKEYCGLFEDARIEWQVAFLKYTSGCICKESEPSIKSCLEKIRCYCWERMHYCAQHKTLDEICVVNKFLKPVVDLLKEEVGDEYQSEEVLKICIKFIDNSIPFLRDACNRFPTFIYNLRIKVEELNNIVKALREKNDFIKAERTQLLSNHIILRVSDMFKFYT